MRSACVFGLSMMALLLVPPGAGDVRAQAEAVELDVPRVVLRGVPFTVTVQDPTAAVPEELRSRSALASRITRSPGPARRWRSRTWSSPRIPA